MSARYLFLSDIDGTLVRGDIGLTPGVIEAAQAFTRAGGLLAVCTGRSPASALPVALELGVNTPCVLYGGAALYDCERRACLWSHPFAPEVRDGIRAVLAQFPGVSVQALTEKEIYVLRRNRRLNERGNSAFCYLRVKVIALCGAFGGSITKYPCRHTCSTGAAECREGKRGICANIKCSAESVEHKLFSGACALFCSCFLLCRFLHIGNADVFVTG